MATVVFEIEFTKDAHDDFRSLDGHIRAAIRQALEVYLRHEPTKVSKSRIKRLRALRRPQFRLRINNYRVYYDVEDELVTILGIVSKVSSYDWLAYNSIEEDD
ncbi:MAG: mRNA interferase RelE/StbE [Verrucomicrobiales bacterium]|jgi:mRNA interferase RelE/StbE